MKRGFTLIEVLLVLAIIAVIAAVTTPYFVRSVRGNRLRMAGRTVVMAGRYARSMAIVRQEELPLTFDLDGGTVSVGSELSRVLDGVKIERVEVGDEEGARTEGAVTVVYGSNGRCTPYKVRLAGSDEDWLMVRVDALSSARVDKEDR